MSISLTWSGEKTGFDVLEKDNISSIVSVLPKIGQALMGGISGFAVNVAVLVLILYFMLIGGSKMETYIYEILPFSKENKREVLKEINMIVTSNAIGIPLLAIIQGVIAMIGYWVFNAPSPFLFGFLTCFATIIPVVGTALVWLPLAVYMALTGDWVNALALTAYALIVITNVDNLIRFILQKKNGGYPSADHDFRSNNRFVPVWFYGNYIRSAPDLCLYTLLFDVQKKEYLDK